MSKLLASLLDVPLVLLEVILDDVALDADVGDDVLGVVLDLVLRVQVGVAAQPPQVHRDCGIEPVGDLACGAHLLAAGLDVDVLILVLD